MFAITGRDPETASRQLDVAGRLFNDVWSDHGNETSETLDDPALAAFISEQYARIFGTHAPPPAGDVARPRPGVLRYDFAGHEAGPALKAEVFALDEKVGFRLAVARAVHMQFPEYSALLFEDTELHVLRRGSGRESIANGLGAHAAFLDALGPMTPNHALADFMTAHESVVFYCPTPRALICALQRWVPPVDKRFISA
jgi:hypothetical protein